MSSISDFAVLLVLTAHGSSGELADYPGNNLSTSARTGWAYINRLRDEPPALNLAEPKDAQCSSNPKR